MSRNAISPAASQASVNIANIFEIDTLSRHDFLKTYQRKTPLQPEKRLLLAVLEDAIEIFQKLAHARNRRQKALYSAAEHWIYDSNADGLFSFNGACEALELNPAFVRRGLTAWRGQRQALSRTPGTTTKANARHPQFDRFREQRRTQHLSATEGVFECWLRKKGAPL